MRPPPLATITLLVVLTLASTTTWLEDFATSPLGVFLATPSQAIPAAIAVAALSLSVWNLIRSYQLTARPKLRAHASVGLEVQTHEFPEGDRDYRELYAVIRNRGDAAAYDVRATVHQRNGTRIVCELPAIKADTQLREVIEVPPDDPADGTLILKYSRGPWRGVRVKFDYDEP